jgi:hypothetical protein
MKIKIIYEAAYEKAGWAGAAGRGIKPGKRAYQRGQAGASSKTKRQTENDEEQNRENVTIIWQGWTETLVWRWNQTSACACTRARA